MVRYSHELHVNYKWMNEWVDVDIDEEINEKNELRAFVLRKPNKSTHVQVRPYMYDEHNDNLEFHLLVFNVILDFELNAKKGKFDETNTCLNTLRMPVILQLHYFFYGFVIYTNLIWESL